MSWLKRGRGKDGNDPVGWVADDSEDTESPSEQAHGGRSSAGDYTDPGPDGSAPTSRTGTATGPWDVSQVESSLEYVDLGGLWLPGRDGMELRLEVEEDTGRVIAATVQLGSSAVQLQAFAAPRTSGIWDEIRKEIASSITRQGGTADEVPGPFGRELLARVPSRSPEGRTVHQPARFAGIDGPRWFLRAVFHGEAAYEADQAAELESLVQQVVVVRGTDAMAPRELLTLRLPEGSEGTDATDGADSGEGTQNTADQDGGREPLRPFERGPEITEVR